MLRAQKNQMTQRRAFVQRKDQIGGPQTLRAPGRTDANLFRRVN
jgi:hypothetical protein